MKIAPELLQQVVDHAMREAPYECCGYLVLDGDRVVEVVEAENLSKSPFRFDMDGRSLYRMGLLEDDGKGAVIYHSHTRSEPVPSQTDMNFAAHWPGVEWLIIGVKGDLDVRNWRMEDGHAEQTAVEVTADAGV
jgi:proteasome lid subunit RPN8/RPN11